MIQIKDTSSGKKHLKFTVKAVPKHVFWFCSNRLYNSDAVYRVTWYNRPFLMMGLIHRATVTVHGTDSVKVAAEVATKEFRKHGFIQQLMGEEY